MAWFNKGKEQVEDKKAAGNGSADSKLQRIAAEFSKVGLKHQTLSVGSLNVIEGGFTGDNCTVKIRVVAVENESEIKVLSENFAKIPAQKQNEGYSLINALNKKYKYVKFVMDDSGEVCAQWDVLDTIPAETLGMVVVEVVVRMSRIIDDAYPEIMKMIWS